MANYGAENIRNVALLSHGGSGKTSLSEAMLFASGVINRLGKVDEGTTTSDYDPDETKRKISINLSLLPCPWKDAKINLLDTPGYTDFVGELIAGLRVAESALIVVCAASGVEVGTELVWQYAEEKKLPRLVFINKMDRENADFFKTYEAIKAHFGTRCVPLQIPIGSQAKFAGIIDLLSKKAFTGSAQGGEIPAELQTQVDTYREKLVEAVAEINDELIAKYLDGAEISQEELITALKQGTKSGKIVPILTGSALQNKGIPSLLDAIKDYLPSPKEAGAEPAQNPVTQKEERLSPDPTAPLAALVFKTSADPYVGKLTYFKVYSGTIYSNSQVWNVNKNSAERIGQLFLLRGKSQEPVAQLSAGDIGAVAKLNLTSTGDTLATKERTLKLTPPSFPPPIYSAAVLPKTKLDLDKLGAALPRIAEEDPTLHVRKEPDTGETIISGMGETHLDVAAEKMLRKFGSDVKLDLPKVPYKETITTTTRAEYKHKKQTGGHGQYGHVLLELEPLPSGSGLKFAERVVGGSVPRNYFPAVEKGVVEASQDGVVAHYPVVDVQATLYDGSFHPVDSSEICFKIAGAYAFKKGLSQAKPVLLEPIMNLKVTVPDNFTGAIISDLNTKRARVMGMNPQGGMNTLEAQVPLAEVQRYAIDLRSITQGRGYYTMEFSHYEEVPSHITQKITAEREKEKAEKA